MIEEVYILQWMTDGAFPQGVQGVFSSFVAASHAKAKYTAADQYRLTVTAYRVND